MGFGNEVLLVGLVEALVVVEPIEHWFRGGEWRRGLRFLEMILILVSIVCLLLDSVTI